MKKIVRMQRVKHAFTHRDTTFLLRRDIFSLTIPPFPFLLIAAISSPFLTSLLPTYQSTYLLATPHLQLAISITASGSANGSVLLFGGFAEKYG